MAAIDFPASPSTGTLFSAANGVTYRYDGTLWLVQAGPGGGTGDFCAINSASINGTPANTQFQVKPDTVITGNLGGWYNTTTGRYTPPAGRYQIAINMTAVPPGGASGSFVNLRKNGVQINTAAGNGYGTTSASANYSALGYFSAILDANGSDYFEFWCLTGVASNLPGVTFSAFPLSGVQGPMGPPFTAGTGAFYATAAAGLTLTATITLQIFNTVLTGNSGGWYNVATGRYTPPAGRYRMFSTVCGFNAAGATAITIVLRKNAATVIAAQQVPAAASWAGDPSVEAILDANGTDIFDITASANNGATVSPSQAWFGSQAVL